MKQLFTLLMLILITACTGKHDNTLSQDNKSSHDEKASPISQFEHVVEDPKGSTLVGVIKDGRTYRVDSSGKIKFESVFFDNGPDYYEDGLARFIVKNKVGFHNMKGDIVIPATYDFATPFREGKSFVCNNCYATYPEGVKCRPVSSAAGCTVIPVENYLEVKGGSWGAIDTTGKVIVPLTLATQEDAEAQLAKPSKQ